MSAVETSNVQWQPIDFKLTGVEIDEPSILEFIWCSVCGSRKVHGVGYTQLDDAVFVRYDGTEQRFTVDYELINQKAAVFPQQCTRFLYSKNWCGDIPCMGSWLCEICDKPQDHLRELYNSMAEMRQDKKQIQEWLASDLISSKEQQRNMQLLELVRQGITNVELEIEFVKQKQQGKEIDSKTCATFRENERQIALQLVAIAKDVQTSYPSETHGEFVTVVKQFEKLEGAALEFLHRRSETHSKPIS